MTACHPARLRRHVAALSSLALLGGLAACGGDDDSTSSDEAGDDASRAGGSGSLVSPLTGESADDGLPTYPVLAVKIDNSVASEPQVGLSGADLITEELVEGGITRLNVFFWSDVPDVVGPVRSMRTSDIGIVKPAKAVLIASGGAFKTRALVDGANITTFTEGSAGYERDDARSAPYNLMMNLPDLVDTLDEADAPAPYLPFGEPDMDGGEPADDVEVQFSGGHTTTFAYDEDEGGYTRPDSYAESGDDFLATSVLVLRVKQTDAGYVDPAGNPVPETVYEGKGQMMLIHDGRVIEGSWAKKKPKSVLTLTDEKGDPVAVPTGTTWIELAPVKADGGDVTVR